MASLFKHPKSQFWSACYTDRHGRQLKRSTKSTDKAHAMRIAIELEHVEKQATAGTVTTTQLRKVMNDVSERITGDSIAAPTVKAYLTGWLAGIEVRNAEGTLERYQNTVNLFLAGLGERANQPITTITPHDIEDFLNKRLKDGAAPKTAIVDLKTLSSAFRRAEAYGTIFKNPVSAVRSPKIVSSERDVFTNDEVQKLINAAPSTEWQTLIIFGYFLGARLGDCVRMKWDNIHPDAGVIIYHQKKTGKKVVVPMHFHVIEHITHISQFGTDGLLCPTLAERGSGGKHGLSESFKRILKRAGIDPMTVQGKGTRKFSKRTFHSLRHSFNSALANAGVAEEVRMKLTGHSSKGMNAQYTHLDVGPLKNAVTSLPMFTKS
jgi:integrase